MDPIFNMTLNVLKETPLIYNMVPNFWFIHNMYVGVKREIV